MKVETRVLKGSHLPPSRHGAGAKLQGGAAPVHLQLPTGQTRVQNQLSSLQVLPTPADTGGLHASYEELGEAASAHSSLGAVCFLAKLLTSLGLRFLFWNEIIKGDYNSYLEGLEDRNNLRERGRVLRGIRALPMAAG